ncbi:hypothetical protein DFH27DRAFT_240498 [Peziza echinospora]|nr:hypothetical protein DFH27DRAFT_240498 [Peziza echinospora]
MLRFKHRTTVLLLHSPQNLPTGVGLIFSYISICSAQKPTSNHEGTIQRGADVTGPTRHHLWRSLALVPTALLSGFRNPLDACLTVTISYKLDKLELTAGPLVQLSLGCLGRTDLSEAPIASSTHTHTLIIPAWGRRRRGAVLEFIRPRHRSP